MVQLRSLLAALTFLLTGASAATEYFKCVAPDGGITYQGCPCTGCPAGTPDHAGVATGPSLWDLYARTLPADQRARVEALAQQQASPAAAPLAAATAGAPRSPLDIYQAAMRGMGAATPALEPLAPMPGGTGPGGGLEAVYGQARAPMPAAQAYPPAAPLAAAPAAESAPGPSAWDLYARTLPADLRERVEARARAEAGSPAAAEAQGFSQDLAIRPDESLEQHSRRMTARSRGDPEASKNAFSLPLLATFAAAIPAVLLFMWIRVKGAASNGQQLGRKWLAWMVASLTLTVGARFFAHNFDLNFLAQWAIGVVVFGGLAYGLGWTYWKLVREKPWKRIGTARMAEPDKDRLYEIAWKEIELKRVDKSLWAKAYAESDGDREKTKARYLKSRVRQLQERTGSNLKRQAAGGRPFEDSARLGVPPAEPSSGTNSEPAPAQPAPDWTAAAVRRS